MSKESRRAATTGAREPSRSAARPASRVPAPGTTNGPGRRTVRLDADPVDRPAGRAASARAPAVASGSDRARRRPSSSATGRRSSPSRPSRSWRSPSATSSSARPRLPTPARSSSTRRRRRPSTPGSSTRLGFFETDMGNSHIVAHAAELPALPAGVRQPLQRGRARSARSRRGCTSRTTRSARRTGSTTSSTARSSSSTATIRPGATAAGQQAFRDYISTVPAEPDLQAAGRQALAGHRPVRRHAASLRRARLGSGLLPGHLGSGARHPVLPDRVRAARLDGTAFAAPPEPQCARRQARRRAPAARRRRTSPAASGSVAPASVAPSAVPSAGSSVAPSAARSRPRRRAERTSLDGPRARRRRFRSCPARSSASG